MLFIILYVSIINSSETAIRISNNIVRQNRSHFTKIFFSLLLHLHRMYNVVSWETFLPDWPFVREIHLPNSIPLKVFRNQGFVLCLPKLLNEQTVSLVISKAVMCRQCNITYKKAVCR